ncbi:unnamed protein product [Brachionus calyciflorus]|uniref:Sulphur transport domain-containing protein n=1 Tax=Brachionus calyciflorus TaxID=104777 RepID=A0A813TU93_9BILA|nr:unnamed protein product [Brachionus calyciflorus]
MSIVNTDENLELKKRNISGVNEEPNKTEPKSSESKANETINNNDLYTLIISGLIGFAFGFILEKCKVYEPKFIRQQMIFNKFLMMKMFFSALAASMLGILILNFIAKERYMKVFESYRDMLKSKSLLVVSSGGLILGLGMTIAGSCPGMMYVQMGAGVNYSYLTFFGGICGALLHGLLNSYLTKSSQADPIVSCTLFDLLKMEHKTVRISLIGLLSLGVLLMEYFVPWKSDYQFRDNSRAFFSLTSEVWQPIIAGFCLGSLQFFSLLLLTKSLGSSSSFSTLASYFIRSDKLEQFPYLKKFKNGISNLGTICFVISVMFGSLISSLLGGVFAQANHVHPFNAYLGGFLLVFGARIAGGCNTGHGISGTSHLFIGSIVAMISMFVSGILLGLFAYTNDFFM